MCLEVVFFFLSRWSEKLCRKFPKFPFRFAYEARKVFEKQEVFYIYILKHFYLHYINFFFIRYRVCLWCGFGAFFLHVFSLFGNIFL